MTNKKDKGNNNDNSKGNGKSNSKGNNNDNCKGNNNDNCEIQGSFAALGMTTFLLSGNLIVVREAFEGAVDEGAEVPAVDVFVGGFAGGVVAAGEDLGDVVDLV